MTAHHPITGTHVLTAPAHIRGKISNFSDPQRKADRIAWLNSLPEGVTTLQIAEALGIRKSSTLKLLKDAGVTRTAKAARCCFYYRGIAAGNIAESIINGMTWEQQDALEAHCARTGQTMAQALVNFWANAHAARGQA